jgi:hypothetical protein
MPSVTWVTKNGGGPPRTSILSWMPPGNGRGGATGWVPQTIATTALMIRNSASVARITGKIPRRSSGRISPRSRPAPNRNDSTSAIAMASQTVTPWRVSSTTTKAPRVAISPWARLMWLVVLYTSTIASATSA